MLDRDARELMEKDSQERHDLWGDIYGYEQQEPVAVAGGSDGNEWPELDEEGNLPLN